MSNSHDELRVICTHASPTIIGRFLE